MVSVAEMCTVGRGVSLVKADGDFGFEWDGISGCRHPSRAI